MSKINNIKWTFSNEENIKLLLEKRISISELSEKYFGKDAVVAGYVKRIKDMGKNLKFLTLADSSDEVQLTFKSDVYNETDCVDELTPQTFIVAKGEACKGRSKKGHEIVVKDFYLLGDIAQPIPTEAQTSLDKRLDYRWIDLREDKHRFPIVLLSEFARNARDFFHKNGFTEIFTPKLIGTPTEGGSEVFTIPYFGKQAYLAQSPQFYKQMAICSGLDKVFEIAPVFRANPSFTKRHDTEFTSLDFETGYISSHDDVMKTEEDMLNHIFSNVKEEWGEKIRKTYNKEVMIPGKIPKIKMEEAYEIVKKENISEQGDLRPEGEKEISKHVKQNFSNDFAFITDFPYQARPFYHMKGKPMSNGNETTRSFDLIYEGLEITTGAQREHRYQQLVKQAQEKGLGIDNLSYYLDFFKYGAPSHGGLGLSPTRVIMGLTDIKNVREATLVPRDPKRLFP
jgi:aspartyl-tRNA synthetase